MLPRARIAYRLCGICRFPAPRTRRSPHPREDGDTTPPRARSPHRPRCALPHTCTPARAQGVAAAPSSSYQHPRMPRTHAAPRAPCTCTPDPRRVVHRASAGFVPDSPPAHWDDTRRMSARVGARAETGTEHATAHVLT
ncbi:hypothetical protein DFH09DRAFT_1315548 [Mycena vulgaris]|nr:hypothetical protein DFH09DRAFT_1315548 [Mycena vulgaris]